MGRASLRQAWTIRSECGTLRVQATRLLRYFLSDPGLGAMMSPSVQTGCAWLQGLMMGLRKCGSLVAARRCRPYAVTPEKSGALPLARMVTVWQPQAMTE